MENIFFDDVHDHLAQVDAPPLEETRQQGLPFFEKEKLADEPSQDVLLPITRCHLYAEYYTLYNSIKGVPNPVSVQIQTTTTPCFHRVNQDCLLKKGKLACHQGSDMMVFKLF